MHYVYLFSYRPQPTCEVIRVAVILWPEQLIKLPAKTTLIYTNVNKIHKQLSHLKLLC